jgi:hypothetical protein
MTLATINSNTRYRIAGPTGKLARDLERAGCRPLSDDRHARNPDYVLETGSTKLDAARALAERLERAGLKIEKLR